MFRKVFVGNKTNKGEKMETSKKSGPFSVGETVLTKQGLGTIKGLNPTVIAIQGTNVTVIYGDGAFPGKIQKNQEVINELLGILSTPYTGNESWNTRYRKNLDKLGNGDLKEVMD